MKSILLIIALTTLSLLKVSASTPHVSAAVNVIPDEVSVVLNLNSINAQIEQFSIVSAEGEIVFSDTIEESKSRIKYNLENLSEGSYTIKIDGDTYLELLEIIVSNNEVIISESRAYTMPSISQSLNKVFVNAKLGSSEGIQVAFYNMEGDLVYSWDGNIEGKFEKVFNLNQLNETSYEVIVSTDYFSNTTEITL